MAVAAERPVPLVERDLALAALSRAAAAVAASSSPRLVLVTGDAGIGKSRLVEEHATTLPDGWAVERLGGDATELAWSAPLDGMVADLPESMDPGRAPAAALAGALRVRRDAGPVLLVVEDVHLLDPSTTIGLRDLLTEVRREPVLVVATYRHGSQRYGSPQSRSVTALLRHPAASELRLAPLSPSGVRTLAAALGATDAEELYRRSDGNPFLLVQLATSTSAAVPETIAELVAATMGGLGPESRELAEILAVAGVPLSQAVVARIDASGGSADELRRASLAVLDGSGLRFRHTMLAEAIAAGLAPEQRARRHARLAGLLALDPTVTDDVLARHWAEAGDLDAAAPLAIAAADRLQGQGRHDRAVELYRIALASERVGPSSGDRAALLERAATAAALAGDDILAAQWAGDARGLDRAAGPASTATATWGNPLFQRLARGRAAGSDGATAPAAAEVSARILAAKEHVCAGELDHGAHVAQLAAVEARRLGDLVLEADAALLIGYAGDLPAGLQLLETIADEARSVGDVGAATVALQRRSRLCIASGELDPAIESNLTSLAIAKATQGPEYWGQPQIGTAFIHALRGELAKAQALADELLLLELPILTLLAQGVEWILAIERGERDGAAAGAEAVLPVARAFGDEYFLVPMLMLGGRSALLLGDLAEAQRLFAEAAAARWSPVHEQSVDILHGQVLAAMGLDDGEALQAAVEASAALARTVPGPAVQGGADFAQAAADLAAGLDAEAAAGFERAARFHERAGRRPMALDAWIAAASSGSGSEAAEARAAALELADAHGFGRPSLERLRRVPAPVSNEVDPLGVLQPRERAIVQMAAEGRTNHEIGAALYISEKTVRNLLTGTFAKLGVKRRSQLAALLSGGSPTP